MTQVPGPQEGVTVALLGTCDTKGRECSFVRDCLVDHGVRTLLLDVGVFEPDGVEPDITRWEVARAAGADVGSLATGADRGAAVATMADGAQVLLTDLYQRGNIQAVLGLGGSGGTAIATAAKRSLPIGVPKLVVSTVASGDTRPYVGSADVTMMPSVVDISGLNAVSSRILSNAAAAIAGMAKVGAPVSVGKPLIGATMFGVTTPCVTRARQFLERRGYDVLVFHATGVGGQSLEEFVGRGLLAGVLDVTTTELADELVGGIMPAGPGRLEAAGGAGVPQVVSLGALDMVNFGPRHTVPPVFAGRRLYVHNPTITLMRTSPAECHELGRRIGAKLASAKGPKTLFVPLRGVSAIAVAGQPFYDPEADAALLSGLRETIDDVAVRELDMDINDARFAEAMARRLVELIDGPK
ncbi:MAG TPA: Tm-1-like ATP-binding domain-containing protein [Acidimicrobiales bacterium]|nr:Tm-1-like ATP-binding domain-containing protein [Acidimicrobiales bacterium]